MRIGSGIPGFYNAASRLNGIDAANNVSRVSDINSASQENNGEGRQDAGYIAQHGGIIKTRVSPENAYQKAKLDNPREIVEDMADKLMSKLPQIMDDMKRLTADDEKAVENQKVVVNERNAAAVAEKAAGNQELMNFSL